MRVSISQLRVLEAVARTGGFSNAAAELGVTQPSVSTQLRALENQTRSKLLDRDGRRLTVTRFGEAVLAKARALLSIANEIERMLEDERNLESGLLRLGYSTHQFAMPAISQFMAAHPGVKLEARSMASLDLIELLKGGRLDAAFVTAQAPPEDLACEKLRTDEIVLMVAPEHPFAGRGRIGWSDLVAHPLIRREGTSGTRIIFDRAAQAAGAQLRTILDLGSWESMRAGVLAGIGVGVALLGEIDPGDRTVVVRIADDALWASHFVACMPEMRQVAAVDALVNIALAKVSISDL